MIILLIVLAVVVLFFLYGVSIYNKLVRFRALVNEAWSSIDVMLKKRYDLIPNLVETVKGYATHESSTLESVTQARARAQSANSVDEKEAAEKNLNQAMMNFFAVAEQYPELKANTHFQQLQSELSTIEGDIEKSRRYYNGTVRENNVLVESFPSSIIAGMFTFSTFKSFELDNVAERTVPTVKF